MSRPEPLMATVPDPPPTAPVVIRETRPARPEVDVGFAVAVEGRERLGGGEDDPEPSSAMAGRDSVAESRHRSCRRCRRPRRLVETRVSFAGVGVVAVDVAGGVGVGGDELVAVVKTR